MIGWFTFFDPMYWLLVGPTVLLALWAQLKVKSAYAKYSRVPTRSGLTGAEAARQMLQREGVTDCRIEQARGFLSDHYDPRTKTLRLSPGVYGSRSVAAVGIACHEAGHALQHAGSYIPLSIRSFLVPVATFGSNMAWIFIIGGILLRGFGGGAEVAEAGAQAAAGGGFGLTVAKIGVALFSTAVLFQLVTLPVEFNASGRAKDALVSNGVLRSQEEITGVRRVLNAAALTYIAAAIAALAQLLYWALRLGLLGGRD